MGRRRPEEGGGGLTGIDAVPGGLAPGAPRRLHRRQRRAGLQVVEVPHHVEACASAQAAVTT